jgi:spore coat protein H
MLALLACQATVPVLTPPDSATPAPPEGDCGLVVEEALIYGVEGDSIRFDAYCDNGAVPQVAGLPEGAELDDGELIWKPDGDQAGIYELLFSGPREQGLPETAAVTLHIADDWDDRDNEPVDPTSYLTEYGLPVIHVQAEGGLSGNYVESTTWLDGVEYPSRIKERGAASSSYPKVGYTLDFDETQLELSDRGMGDKAHLVLISTFDDNAYVRQMLAYGLWADIAEHQGVEDRLVVRTFPCVLYLDDEYQGVYIAADHVDDEFLGQMGLDRDSPLYKAVSHDANFYLTDYYGNTKSSLHAGYELKEGEDWGPLDDLVSWSGSKSDQQVVNQAGSWIRAEEIIDWWIFVTFTAAADSAGKNSYLAYDAATGHMRYAPWDFNHSWGQDWRTLRVDDGYAPDYRNWNRLFRAFLDADSEHVAQRWASLTEDGAPMSEEALVARLDGLYEDLEPAAERDWDRWGSQYRSYSGWSSLRDDDWNDYPGEKAYLYDWVRERAAWAREQEIPY